MESNLCKIDVVSPPKCYFCTLVMTFEIERFLLHPKKGEGRGNVNAAVLSQFSNKQAYSSIERKKIFVRGIHNIAEWVHSKQSPAIKRNPIQVCRIYCSIVVSTVLLLEEGSNY